MPKSEMDLPSMRKTPPSEDLHEIAAATLRKVADGNMIARETSEDVKELLPLRDLLKPSTDEERSLVQTLIGLLEQSLGLQRATAERLDRELRTQREMSERIAMLEAGREAALVIQERTANEVRDMHREIAELSRRLGAFLANFEEK